MISAAPRRRHAMLLALAMMRLYVVLVRHAAQGRRKADADTRWHVGLDIFGDALRFEKHSRPFLARYMRLPDAALITTSH